MEIFKQPGLDAEDDTEEARSVAYAKLRDAYIKCSKSVKWLRAALDLAEGGTTDIEILETMAERED